jgi:hypothetical protein
MRKILLIVCMVGLSGTYPCFGQHTIIATPKTSLTALKDSTLFCEIASFTLRGKALNNRQSCNSLRELPIGKRGKNFANFSNGFFGSSLVTISINDSTGGIQYLTCSIGNPYFPGALPDSAFSDIYAPRIYNTYSKKKTKSDPSSKVLISNDRRRAYIYMINGEGADRYEVTWIIKDQKYFGRVIDAAPL